MGNNDYRVTPLCEFPVRWVVRTDLVPKRGVLTIDDLERVPVLTFSKTSSPQAHVRALFIDRDTEPRVCSFPSVESIIQLVGDGYGIAAIPPVFVRERLLRGELQVCEGPALPPLVITVMSERGANRAVRETQALTTEVVAAFCDRVGDGWARRLDPGPPG